MGEISRNTFFDELTIGQSVSKNHTWNQMKRFLSEVTTAQIEQAIAKKGRRSIYDFAALLSPAAEPYFQKMAELSRSLTLKRFGKTMQLYVPLYVSNYCENSCTYCGFSGANPIKRKVLTLPEIERESSAIASEGFTHLLLVSGESDHHAGVEYLCNVLKMLRSKFANISLEVQPLSTDDYRKVIEAGCDAVYIYQETYNELTYPKYHPKGKKSDFKWRLETPDRLGDAGIFKIGLGVLLGLEDWRVDSIMTALHIRYLQKKYWRTRYCVSFPRLRPAEGSTNPEKFMSEAELAALIFAWRIFDEDIEISVSTRESATFRDKMMEFGTTSMSAGSKTMPGGYCDKTETQLEQFSVHDDRSPLEVKMAILKKGYEPVWKDWDSALH